MSKPIIAILIMVVYVLFNWIIIQKKGKEQTSLEEYAVGSRSLGWMLNCFASIGSWYVGAMYVGWFANAATIGIFAQYILVYSVAAMVYMYYMARPVWVWGKVYGLESEGDYIAKRYNSTKFSFIFMLIIFCFYVPWLMVEFKALGYIINAATYYYVDFNIGMLIVGAIVIAYSFMGGVRATAIGGLIQGITIGLFGIILVYAFIVKAYGGLFDVYQLVEDFKPQLLTLSALGGKYWASIIITCSLGGYVLPGIFVSMYRTESPRATKKGVMVSPIVGVFMGFLILVAGLGATSFAGFPEDPQQGAFFLADKFGGAVGMGILGILGLAACMSSIAVFLNVFAVIIAKDLIGRNAPNMSPAKQLKIAKWSTIIIGIGCIFGAFFEIPNLMFIVLGIYDCCVQAFPIVFLGIFWKRANIQGAILGFTLGSFWALAGNFIAGSIVWAGGWNAGMVGLAFNFTAMIVCGFVFKKQSHVDEMFDVAQNFKEPRLSGSKQTA